MLLEEIPFRNPGRARANLLTLAARQPEDIVEQVRYLLSGAADPDRALDYLERLRNRQPDMFPRLLASPACLQSLIAVFCHSRFLSEEVLRRPEWLQETATAGDLHRILSVEEMSERLEAFLVPGVPSAVDLARFRRREILRILLRDVRGLAELSEVTAELSHLADAVLHITYLRIRADLERKHGAASCGFSVLAMGKLGGGELNYSSDIDLMFVYGENGETAGPHAISNKEFFKKIANRYTDILCAYTPEGMCYRVDLRLRPDGKLGEVSMSLDGAMSYYQTRGRDWELQMLIKARVAAGEPDPGERLLAFVEPLIYSTTLDFCAVEAVSATRMRIHEKLASRRGSAAEIDVKLTSGGIRDIEFLTQCLQRLHGGREPWIRHVGTLPALARLRDKALLSPTEYARLASAYQFLRNLEHRLQFADDRQTHVLPADSGELDLLAHRMPPSQSGTAPSPEGLLRELSVHIEEVQAIYERVIHAQQPVYYMDSPAPQRPTLEFLREPASPSSNVVRFLDQRAPGLAQTLAENPLPRGTAVFEHFLEKIVAQEEWLKLLDSDSRLATRVLDVFANSPYLSDALLRTPALLAEFALFGSGAGEPPADADAVELRRFFRRETFRALCESVCVPQPVFRTLAEISQLGERVIAAAYRIAVQQTLESHPPASPGYLPEDQMMVIALGRLGMREFDLGSDADLVFVLPNCDVPELLFWTRTAEKMIEVISAYTGEGVMFAIDTRLRPNGREGALVQTEFAFYDYFERSAQTWEGITYMKSHAVAGDIVKATEFLNALQEIDFRRYGQSGRSQRELQRMRLRLEREQGQSNPLKAGQGGYYDIDFALMYLRLKSAGFFFKLLNTPARIDVIEKMGHLEREDAAFLRDAAGLYRAIDHGLRLITGHAEGSLPKAQPQLEMLTELVSRWTPVHLHAQPLADELARIQAKTREYFDRLFAA